MYYITNAGKLHNGTIDRLANSLASFCFPGDLYCSCCGKLIDGGATYSVCDFCREAIDWGHVWTDLELSEKETGRKLVIDSILAAAYYGLYTRVMVEEFKNNGRTHLARTISEIMWERLVTGPEAEETLASDLIVPAPSSTGSRGFNQSLKLARHLSRKSGIPVLDCLTKDEGGKSQKRASGEERFANIMGSIRVREGEEERLAGKNILLLDDLCTTGATLNECARILKDAGAVTVNGLVFATKNRYSRGYFTGIHPE